MRWRLPICVLMLLLCVPSGSPAKAADPVTIKHMVSHPMEQLEARLQVGTAPLVVEKESFAPLIMEIATTENQLVRGLSLPPGRHLESLDLAPGRYILRVRPMLRRGDREIVLHVSGAVAMPAHLPPPLQLDVSPGGQVLLGRTAIALAEEIAAPVEVTVDGQRLEGSSPWDLDPDRWGPGIHTVTLTARSGDAGLAILFPWIADPAPPYLDLTESARWVEPYTRLVADRGWMKGYPDGTFRPDELVSRAQLAEILLRLFGPGEADPAAGSDRFVDLPSGAWYERSAAVAHQRGWIKGAPQADGLAFEADRPVTRDELAVILCRALGWEALAEQVTEPGELEAYAAAAAPWARPCITLSWKVGLFGSSTLQPIPVGWEPDLPVTRAELSLMLSLLIDGISPP